jgi:hypothetical protein
VVPVNPAVNADIVAVRRLETVSGLPVILRRSVALVVLVVVLLAAIARELKL